MHCSTLVLHTANMALHLCATLAQVLYLLEEDPGYYRGGLKSCMAEAWRLSEADREISLVSSGKAASGGEQASSVDGFSSSLWPSLIGSSFSLVRKSRCPC